MIKRITSIILVLLLCLQSTAFASFKDIDTNASYAKAADRLNTLNIMNGKGEGNFDPNGNVTRAEMAKIVATLANLDVQESNSSLFSDMEEGNWANGYVNTVAIKGLISGYPDGTFKPDSNITYAETLTIILRLLGYGSKELGNNYPKAFIQKAKELGLTEGLNYNDNDYLDRKSIALLVDKALVTNVNNNGSKKTKLIERMEYSVSDECIIIATNNESKELLTDEVVTSIGTYKKLNDNVDSYVTQTCKLILDKERRVVSAIPVQKQNKTYIIQGVTGNEISSDNGIVKMDPSSVVYFKNKKATFSAISDTIKAGTKMTAYYSANGEYDYAVMTEYELAGPVVFYDSSDISTLGINIDGLKVIRDGKRSSLESLQKYDVLYYDKYSKIIYSYCNKVSGIYEEAYPNKENVTSIKLSGEKYSLETQIAVKALNESSNAFKKNEYITALLGKDKKIVAVVSTDSATASLNYGVLLSSSEKVVNGTKNYYAKFLSATGIEQEFKVDMKYEDERGKVAEFNFESGVMRPFFNSDNKISGILDKQNRKIGDYWLSKDCKVIDLSYAPGKIYEKIYLKDSYDKYTYGNKKSTKKLKEYPDAIAKYIDLNEITTQFIDTDEVVHAQLDKNGKVVFLVLNNVTMDRYKFGVVTDANKSSSSSTYNIEFAGSNGTYSIENAPSPEDGDAVMASIQDNQLLEIRKLEEIKVNGDFGAIDKQKVKVGTTYYSLAKDAVVFIKSGNETVSKDDRFDAVSIDDIKNYKISKVHLYLDKPSDKGGRVRVVVFTLKP